MTKQNIATLVTILGLGCGPSQEQQVAYEKQLQVYNEQQKAKQEEAQAQEAARQVEAAKEYAKRKEEAEKQYAASNAAFQKDLPPAISLIRDALGKVKMICSKTEYDSCNPLNLSYGGKGSNVAFSGYYENANDDYVAHFGLEATAIINPSTTYTFILDLDPTAFDKGYRINPSKIIVEREERGEVKSTFKKEYLHEGLKNGLQHDLEDVRYIDTFEVFEVYDHGKKVRIVEEEEKSLGYDSPCPDRTSMVEVFSGKIMTNKGDSYRTEYACFEDVPLTEQEKGLQDLARTVYHTFDLAEKLWMTGSR